MNSIGDRETDHMTNAFDLQVRITVDQLKVLASSFPSILVTCVNNHDLALLAPVGHLSAIHTYGAFKCNEGINRSILLDQRK